MKIMPKIVAGMALNQQIFTWFLAVCMTASSMLGGFQITSPVDAHSSKEFKIYNVESPGLAILSQSEKPLTSIVNLQEYFLGGKISFDLHFLNLLTLTRESLLINSFMRNVFYVVISINAP